MNENASGMTMPFSVEEIDTIRWALGIALAEQKKVIKKIECTLAEAELTLQRAKKIAAFLSSDKSLVFQCFPRDAEIERLRREAEKMRDGLRDVERLWGELCGVACGEVKDE